MIHAVMALSMLVSSVPAEGLAPLASHLTAPSRATLLENADTHPALRHSLLVRADDPARRTYKKFLLIRQGGERIEGSEGVLEEGRLTGMSLTGTPVDVALDDIKTLYTSSGSRAGTGALYGGLTGMAITGSCVLLFSFIPHFFSYEGAVLGSVVAVGAGTLVGAGIGALIGSMGNDWHVEPVVSPGKVYVLRISFKL